VAGVDFACQEAGMSRSTTNILVITCHDLGRFLRCYGVATVRTPNLDAFAAEGILFSSAFATAPQCSPSRSSIFTGRYPHANGVLGLTHGEFGWDLHPDELHLAQALSAAGYTTSMIGILHEAREIERCGFDEVFFPGHDARQATEAAVTSLRRLSQQEQPFYLQLGYHEPHRVPAHARSDADFLGFSGNYITPDDRDEITVPPYIVNDQGAREEMAELQGAVHHLDEAVGVVLDELRALEIDNETMVIFTTDHGLALPRAKCSLYDPGLEVALLMRFPARGWSGGRQVPGLISNVDIFPTILDAANLPPPATIHGRSLAPLLDGETESGRDIVFGEITYHDYYQPQRCVRTDRYKLIVNFTTSPAFMDPSQSWHRRVRPVYPPEPALSYGLPVELYDLTDDPNEWINLAIDPAYQGTRDELLAHLYRWMRDTGDPLLSGAVTSPRHRNALAFLEDSVNDEE
jgi:N-sulfoglucosamine sulfohydrolase